MMKTLDSIIANERYRVVFIAFLAFVIMFTKIADNGLATYDDCYYAQKAKEIHETGSWMTMHHAGIPSFENAPMFMWLIALSYDIWGTNEYAAIFPSALFGVLSVILVYFFARKLFNTGTAFFASFVLTTTFYYTKFARHAMMDVTLSFFVTLALFALVMALRHDKRYFILWGLSISVCILLKSILGFFPLVITLLFLLLTKRWKTMFNGWFLFGIVTICTLGCSWYIHQYLTHGKNFLDVHFGWLILQRGFGSEAEPWYAHFSLFVDFIPYHWLWSLLFIWSLYRFFRLTMQRNENALLLLCWVLTIPLVISLNQSRIFWYIMPVFPGAAIMCGYTIDGWLSEIKKLRIIRWIVVIGFIIGLVFNITPVRLSTVRQQDVRTIAPYIKYLTQQHVKLIGFRFTYNALNNPLLYYSDHAAIQIFEKYGDLNKVFGDSAAVMCVVHAEHLDSVLTQVPGVHVIRRTMDASLIANRVLDVSGVKTW